MLTRISIASLLLVVSTVAVAAPAEDAIRAQADAWVKAFNAGDAARVAALYTTDGMVLPPGSKPSKGREAIAATLSPFFAGPEKVTMTIDTTALEVHGNSAHRVGTWSITAADGSVVDGGNFIEIWKKSGGDWLLAYDIWNSDGRAAPAAAK